MMKAQSVSDLLDKVFFSGFRIRPVKPDKRDRFKSYSAPDFKPRLESARKSARRVASCLPDSLQDWLNCKAALEISRRDRDTMTNGARFETPAGIAELTSDTKNPSAMRLAPQTA